MAKNAIMENENKLDQIGKENTARKI